MQNDIKQASTKPKKKVDPSLKPEQATSTQQAKKQAQLTGAGKDADTTQAVSIAAKNGQQRITVDKSTNAPSQTMAGPTKGQQAGKKETQTMVNGRAVQKQDTPKKKKGPKL